MKIYNLLWVIVLASCSSIQDEKYNQTRKVINDTINIGAAYNSTFATEIGHTSFTNERNQTITHFQNDSSHKVIVTLSGKKQFPFKVVSLNKNIVIKPVEGEKNAYWFLVSRKAADTLEYEGEKIRYDAKIAFIAHSDSVKYYLRNRSWLDFTKTKYNEYVIRLDTFATEYMHIKDK